MLPGLRYGETSDTIFNVKDKLKKDSSLKVVASLVHKNKELIPFIKYVEI